MKGNGGLILIGVFFAALEFSTLGGIFLGIAILRVWVWLLFGPEGPWW